MSMSLRKQLTRALTRPIDSGGPVDNPHPTTDETPMSPPIVPSCAARILEQAGVGHLARAVNERYIVPQRIKEVGPLMEPDRLMHFLATSDSPHAALAHRLFVALQSVEAFEREFAVMHAPPLRRNRSVLPPHIFAAATAKGILSPLPRRYRPVTAAPLKAVADRKQAGVGRLIYPACAINEACRKPDPCPLPLLPDMIKNIQRFKYGFTADLRSWFYSFPVSRDVAARYFATYDSHGRGYAHVRGPMGFSHMPTLATSVAMAMVDHAISGLSAYGVAWIDDITIVANTIQDAQEAQKRFLVLAAHLDIEVRDLTAVSPQIKAVGIEYDLQQHRWRLLDAWRSKVLESGLPPKADFDAQRLLLEAGRVAWAAYALQVPFLPFSDGLREAGRLANNLITGTNTVEDPVDLSEKAFRSLRMGRALINRNPWRTIAPSPSMTVVTDASTYGFGLMYEENGKCVERSVPNAMHSDADDEHITVREAVALRLAVCRPQHMNRSVTCVTDNSALFWILQRGRMPRGTSLRHEVVKLFRWCFKFEVTLFPMWLCTASMAQFGADEASRSSLGYTKYVMKSRLRDCVKCAAADTAVLAAGCHMPARIGRYALPQDLASQMFDSLGPKPA